jgi:putative copper export protein
MSSWLGLIHGIDLLLTSVFVGGVAFSAWIGSACGPAVEKIRNPWGRSHTVFLLMLIFLAALWFVLLSHDMTDTWNLEDFKEVALSSVFGRLWIGKIVFLLALILVSATVSLRYLYFLALPLPLFSSLSGHAAAQKTLSFLYITLDYVHFFGASIWVGGLIALVLWLRARLFSQSTPVPEITHVVVRRFSHFAIASTGAIAASGLILAYLYGVRPNSLLSANYGKLVLVKTALFVLVLAIASVNQFVHLRNWSPATEHKFARGVFRESLCELSLIFVVIIIAGLLSRTDVPL